MLSWDEFHQEDNLAPVSKAKIEQPSVTSEFQPSELTSIPMIPKAQPADYQATLDRFRPGCVWGLRRCSDFRARSSTDRGTHAHF